MDLIHKGRSRMYNNEFTIFLSIYILFLFIFKIGPQVTICSWFHLGNVFLALSVYFQILLPLPVLTMRDTITLKNTTFCLCRLRRSGESIQKSNFEMILAAKSFVDACRNKKKKNKWFELYYKKIITQRIWNLDPNYINIFLNN